MEETSTNPTSIDVTQHGLARKKIDESETQLRLITDALPVLIAYIDKNRRYRFINKTYETWFGHSKKEILGKHIKDVLGEAAYKNLKPNIDQVLSGKPVNFEMLVPYKEGGTKWVVANYIPSFGKDNEVLGYYALVNDVTSQKKAEELNLKLAAIVQSSTAAIISKTLEGIVTSWNSGAEKIFGYTAAEMIGEPITRIIPDDRKDEEPRIIKNISEGKIVDHFDTQRLTKEGKLLDISLTISPIKDSEGKIVGASKIARDITEFIEARKKIEESEKQQAFLLKLSDALRPLGYPVDIEEAATKTAMDFMEADRCHYSTIEEDNVIILRDASRSDFPSVAGVHPISSFPLYKAVLNAGRPFVVDDVRTTNIIDEDLKKVCLQFQYGSFINVPVIKNGKPVGLLSLVQGKPRKWTNSEVQLTVETAERIWAAVERAKAEEALRKSEEQLRGVLEQAPLAIAITDARGDIQFSNTMFDVLWGRPAHETEASKYSQVYAGFQLDGTPIKSEEWPGAKAVMKGEVVMEEVLEIVHQSGRKIPCSFNAGPIRNDDGKITGGVVLFRDVTEQILSRKKIEQSEKKFEAAILAVEGIIWTNNADGEMIGEQFGWANLTGQRFEEYQGYGWAKAVHPDDAGPTIDAWNKAVATKSTFVFEHRINTKQHGYKLFSIKAVPVFDQHNDILHWVGVHTDISEQREAAKKIKESEERFRAMADAAPNIIWALNPDGSQKYVNKYALDYLGVPLEEMISLKWQSFIHPDDLEGTGKAVADAVQNRTFYSREHRLLRHDGVYRWFLSQGAPSLFENGELYGFVGSGIDITERKATEEALAYRTALLEAHNEASVDGILLVDAKGKILSHNQRFVEIWNIPQHIVNSKDDEAALSFAMTQLVNPQQFIDKVKYLYAHPTETCHDELDFKDGKIVERNGYPVVGEDGTYYAWSWTFRNITKRKQFENELMEAKVSAENAAKAKQQFLSNMSHEIRTPLSSILGFTYVLSKTDLGAEQKEFLQAIKTSGNSLNLLINDILDLAKVDAGRMTFDIQPFEIRKSIKSILYSFDLKVKEKNLELINECDSNIPLILLGDSVRLNQIILNLVSNAVKFTHKGKIVLAIKLLNQDEGKVTIEFALTDSGIGIANDKVDSIFKVFEQAEIGTANTYGGTGLGLAIVKQLIEAQGGSISLKSKLGEGSTFSFILPFGKTNVKSETEIEIPKPDSENRSLRVLVAEDVALNQLLIKIILSDFGFEFEIVDNGKIAVEKFQANTYDIILMDLHMPEMNGFQATEYIRQTVKSKIPIIALTADVTNVDVSKCKEFGMDDYVSKPINESLLYSKIVELVKMKQYEQN